MNPGFAALRSFSIKRVAMADWDHHFVSEYARLTREGKGWPLGGFPKCARPAVAPDAPKVLIFSPHPDDEVIIGGLALRLLREAQWNVINVAVTQGSNRARPDFEQRVPA